MKVLFVNSTKTWGGIRTWYIHMIREFSSTEVKTFLICRPDNDFVQQAEKSGAHVYQQKFGMDYSPIQILKAIKRLKKLKPDIIITNISKEVRIYGVAAKILKIPVIARLGLDKDLKNNSRNRLEYKNLIKGVIVPCQAIKNGFPKNLIDTQKVKVIYNGAIIPPSQNKPSLLKRNVKIVYVGKINKRKGLNELIEAFIRLHKDGIKFSANIIGEGELLETLRTKTNEYKNIQFLGHQNNFNSYLEEADIGVMHSRYEGFPNTLLEYMSNSLAILTTPVDGIPEMLSDQKNAVFTPYGDVDAIYNGLKDLIKKPEKINELGTNAYNRANQDFNIKIQARKVLDYLKESTH